MGKSKWLMTLIYVLVIFLAYFKTQNEKSFIGLLLIPTIYLYIDVKRKAKKEKLENKILKSLSDEVLAYLIYLESGYDTYHAFIALGHETFDEGINENILRKEIKKIEKQVVFGVSFSESLHKLNKEYQIRDLNTFLRYIENDYLKGDIDPLNYKQLLVRIYESEQQKLEIRIKSAQVHLTFPMACIFIVILIISIYPALMDFHI